MTTLIVTIFVIGYFAIALEHYIKVNKTATALLTGVLCWTVYVLASPDKHEITRQLLEHVGDFSGILFFLLGAMTIVELIDAHDGFDLITSRIGVKSKRSFLWVITWITFFLSSILDNLTTAIVMVSLLSKFKMEKEERLLFASLIVIAANAGGAWTTIGDVTTTMLWIAGRITSLEIMKMAFIPSILNALVPLVIITFWIKGDLDRTETKNSSAPKTPAWERNTVLILGLGGLLSVPVFKSLTELPPFMGMILALSVLWIFTEFMHSKKSDEQKEAYSIVQALRNIDLSSVLFFLGILTCIAALQSIGQLGTWATYLNTTLKNPLLIDTAIGLLSAIVDNVPLVAGTIGMYTLDQFPVNHQFWGYLSYCAGTGGSILIIGSAAGVATMGLVKIDFMWYMKRIAPPALAGYFVGALFYAILEPILR
jgi:Na+/H+ antiporter NhaD/arsenite permease-like protein